MKYTLDFSLLPELDYAGILTTLNEDIEAMFLKIGVLQETLNRAKGALMLFSKAFHANGEAWKDEAYIRAGLNEFYSIEQALIREHKLAKLPGPPLEINISSNPLLHLMRLMRNLDVHTESAPLINYDTTVTIHFNDPPKEWTYTTVIIKDLTIDRLCQKRGVKKNYEIDQLDKVVQWFLENQKNFGVSQVFRKGTEAYCLEFLSRY